MKKRFNLLMPMLLVLIMVLSLSPATTPAESQGTVTVRIIGEDSIILNTTVNNDNVKDYTYNSADSSSSINALDAVIFATVQNSVYDTNSYNISYNPDYSSYYINKIAGITPSGSDYWGTLAVSSSDNYDGGALSAHALTAGDTYIVYYDKNTGTGANYGYQSYAWFTKDTISGTAGSVIPVEAMTTGYDTNWNTVAIPLSGETIYATGDTLATPIAIAVTGSDGKAYITFPDAGTYTLTLSSAYYTYAKCVVTVIGSSVTLNNVSINVTDGANNLSNASLSLTDNSGSSTHSPYEIGSGTYKYRLADGTYKYYASASGYAPASGTVAVTGDTSQSVQLMANSGHKVTITPGDATNETVIIRNSNSIAQATITTFGGVYTYNLADGNYSYTVSRSGYHSCFGSFTVSGLDRDITTAALTDTAANNAEWPALRDFGDNMATVSYPTAQGSWQTREKWTTSLGSLGSWGALATSNIVLYDGYLYVATEHGLSKIDKSSGKLLTSAALSTGTSYMTQIAYGNGKIFVTTASGVDAFDALTMELVWSAPISTYGNYMAATPILYDNTADIIYVGDYGDSNNNLGTFGGYSALDATDGTNKWIMYGGATDARYGAGTVMFGDYVVFGSDSGTLTSVKTNASGYAAATDTLSATGKIRSSVACDSDYLYFTTQSGYIYKVSIDSTGKLTNISSRQFSAAGSNSTPVVYKGKIYVGASDGIYVLKADDLSQVSHYAASAAVQSSALLTTAYDSTVYAYFTVNSPRGEIIVLSDSSANVSYDTLYIPKQAQYSLTSLIADSDGTIYYTNDSGYISAIQNNHESSVGKVRATISVSPDSVYDSSTWTTTYPTITLKDSSSTEVATAVPGTYYLAAGSYSYTVSLSGYTSATGNFTVTKDDIDNSGQTVSVMLSTPSSGTTISTVTATVSVIGDSKHGNNAHTAYVTWVNSKSVTVSSGATAWDAIKKALDSSGLSYVATETSSGIYISSVNGLAETDNGPNSGWLYSVNGATSNVGASNYILTADASVILYYTDDYTKNEISLNEGESSDTLSGSSSSTAIEYAVTAALDKKSGVANATLSGDTLTKFNKAIAAGGDVKGSGAVITVGIPNGATTMKLTIPQTSIAALGKTSHTSLRIKTDLGNLTFDSKAVAAISSSSGSEGVIISIAQVDKSALSDKDKKMIGNRPVYDISVTAGATVISSFDSGSASIGIPYILGTGEDKNAIVVYCIDASGSLQTVRGVYNCETQTVNFTTTHFSRYAVGYNKVIFADVADTSWYNDAVTFCAACGITTGIDNGMFGPENTLTRGQFIVMLMRAYGIETDENPTNNFADAGDTYYTNCLAAAKRLGISNGVGNNMYAPDSAISRQDMFTLLYRTLDLLGKLTTTATSNTLSNYSDAREIADYAVTALKTFVESGIVSGSEGKFNPSGNSNRAQMVQVLYNVLSKDVIL